MADEVAGVGDDGHDPFAPIEASPRGATLLAVGTFGLAIAALLTGLAPLFGPLGMATGLVAHVKGSRLGLPGAVASGVATIAGMVVIQYLR